MNVTNLGPYELNSIHCGECSQLMAALPDNSIDLTVTSPPYDNLRIYNGYVFPFEAIAQQLYRVTKPGGVVVWVVGDATIDGSETGTSFRQALYFMSAGFKLYDTMIYEKSGQGGGDTSVRYLSVAEFMFIFSKEYPATINIIRDRKNITCGSRKSTRTDKRISINQQPRKNIYVVGEFGPRTNIWKFLNGNATQDDKTNHPAIFPEALARDHILSWSNPGDIILDPMAGSGTTLKMAKATGRRFLGFDISQEYCELAQKRVNGVSELLSGFAEAMTPKPKQDNFFPEE